MLVITLVLSIISGILLIITALRNRWGLFTATLVVFLISIFSFDRLYNPSAQFTADNAASDTQEVVSEEDNDEDEKEDFDYESLEVDPDEAYIEVNGNQANFSQEELEFDDTYVEYGELDSLGRATAANAVLHQSTLPGEEDEYEPIDFYPTGWQEVYPAATNSYSLYDRVNLISFRLSSTQTEPENVITGTQEFLNEGLNPFVTQLEDFLRESDHHVRVRVTPVFDGNNLLASGLYYEAQSIEDDGEGLNFFVYIPNRQAGVDIDYSDGNILNYEPIVEETTETVETSEETTTVIETYIEETTQAPEVTETQETSGWTPSTNWDNTRGRGDGTTTESYIEEPTYTEPDLEPAPEDTETIQ